MKRRLIVLLSVFILIIIYACTPQEMEGTNESHNPNQEFDTGDSETLLMMIKIQPCSMT